MLKSIVIPKSISIDIKGTFIVISTIDTTDNLSKVNKPVNENIEMIHTPKDLVLICSGVLENSYTLDIYFNNQIKFRIEVNSTMKIDVHYKYKDHDFILDQILALKKFSELETLPDDEIAKYVRVIPNESYFESIHVFKYPEFKLLIDSYDVAAINYLGIFNMDDYLKDNSPYKISNMDEVQKEVVKYKISKKDLCFTIKSASYEKQAIEVKISNMTDLVNSIIDKASHI